MIFEHIEKLKGDYTDKYVVVDEQQPELRRFRGMTGTVRTVNMNGHALVEFDEHNNIGWYDINLDFLKVVDQPIAKPEKAPAKPAAKKPAPAKPAAKAGGKSSTSDILAMARGGAKPAAAESASAKDTAGMSTADKLAALRGGAPTAKKEEPAEPAATPKDTSAMNTADKLAMLRGGGAPAKQDAPAAEEPADEELEIGESQEQEEPAAAPAADRPAPGSLSIDEMIAWCREHDAS